MRLAPGSKIKIKGTRCSKRLRRTFLHSSSSTNGNSLKGKKSLAWLVIWCIKPKCPSSHTARTPEHHCPYQSLHQYIHEVEDTQNRRPQKRLICAHASCHAPATPRSPAPVHATKSAFGSLLKVSHREVSKVLTTPARSSRPEVLTAREVLRARGPHGGEEAALRGGRARWQAGRLVPV